MADEDTKSSFHWITQLIFLSSTRLDHKPCTHQYDASWIYGLYDKNINGRRWLGRKRLAQINAREMRLCIGHLQDKFWIWRDETREATEQHDRSLSAIMMTIEPDVGCATYSDARHVKDYCCCGWGTPRTCFGYALEMLTGRHKRNHYHQTSVLANGQLTHLQTFVRPDHVNASEREIIPWDGQDRLLP